MFFVYYDEHAKTVHFRRAASEDHGMPIGTLDVLPVRPAFAAQAMLANRGFNHVTGTRIEIEPATNQEKQ